MNKLLLTLVSFVFMFQGCVMAPERSGLPPAQSETPAVVQPPAAPGPVAGPVAPAPVGDATDEEPAMKYSDATNMAPPSDRNYKRMTRERMEEESELYGSAGSLWKMDGQTSYLFAENKHRREGDVTAIKMEGQALKQIESKVAVVQDLLAELDVQKKKAEEDAKKAEQERQRLAQIEEEKRLKAEAIARGDLMPDPFEGQYPQDLERKPAAVPEPEKVAEKPAEKAEKIDLKEIEMIPSKVVEKLSEGIYRIRGQQFLTIKKKPYKVIATALVRADDYNDTAISSNKLLDAQYDVIHVKKSAAQ
jgi:flagellar L-ring protein FlgH